MKLDYHFKPNLELQLEILQYLIDNDISVGEFLKNKLYTSWYQQVQAQRMFYEKYGYKYGTPYKTDVVVAVEIKPEPELSTQKMRDREQSKTWLDDWIQKKREDGSGRKLRKDWVRLFA